MTHLPGRAIAKYGFDEPETSENTPMSLERRRHVRKPTNLETLWAPITGTYSKGPVRIRDISQSGARLEVDHPVAPGDRVRIQLTSVVEARLIYVQQTPQGKWTTGCQFDFELTEEEMEPLVRN
jgi:hypothetical protein